MWDIMKVQKNTGIKLTSSLAMWPAASTCGLYFANKHAHYFSVGKIMKDQVCFFGVCVCVCVCVCVSVCE